LTISGREERMGVPRFGFDIFAKKECEVVQSGAKQCKCGSKISNWRDKSSTP
jgi:hypothetical protein